MLQFTIDFVSNKSGRWKEEQKMKQSSSMINESSFMWWRCLVSSLVGSLVG